MIPETGLRAKDSNGQNGATAMPRTFVALESSAAWSAPAPPIRFTAVSDAFSRERTAFGFRWLAPQSGASRVTRSVHGKRKFFSLAGLPSPGQSHLSPVYHPFMRESSQFTFGRRSQLFATWPSGPVRRNYCRGRGFRDRLVAGTTTGIARALAPLDSVSIADWRR